MQTIYVNGQYFRYATARELQTILSSAIQSARNHRVREQLVQRWNKDQRLIAFNRLTRG